MTKQNVFIKVDVKDTLIEIIENCYRRHREHIEAALECPEARESVEGELQLEEFLDSLSASFLPDNLKGYNRLDSVHAWPFEFPADQMYPNTDRNGQTVMTLGVDGSKAIVVPSSIITRLYYGDRGKREVVKLAYDYWSSAVTLKDFRARFRKPEGSRKFTDYDWYDNCGNVIKVPEVLIPSSQFDNVSVMGVHNRRRYKKQLPYVRN